MDGLKYHWYLVSGRSVQGTHNKPFGMASNKITQVNLDWFKNEITEQAVRQGFPCTGFVILNISYLGEMAKKEFLE